MRYATDHPDKKKARKIRAYNNGLVSAGINPITILKLFFAVVKFFNGFFINMNVCRL